LPIKNIAFPKVTPYAKATEFWDMKLRSNWQWTWDSALEVWGRCEGHDRWRHRRQWPDN